jgi:hypothetical protein
VKYLKINKLNFLNTASILLVSIGVIFFETPSVFYYLAVLFSLFVLIIKKNISKSVFSVYLFIFLILLFSLFSPFFDYKYFLNSLGFLVFSVAISSSLISEKKSLKVLDFFLKFIVVVVLISLIYILASSSYNYIFNLDFNTVYLKIYESIGIFKQIFGQLLVISFFYFLHINKWKKLYRYVILTLIFTLMIGTRSILFGLICLSILKLFSKKYFFIISVLILAFHYVFIFFIIDNPFFDALFQFDIRWGMQAISIFTAEKFFFGIGYGGWNEYAVSGVSELLKYTYYLPAWQGFTNENVYIPTTLESSLFQLNAEIGFLLNILLFLFLFKIILEGYIFKMDKFLILFTNINLVILFSSFYEDNLFQPFWYIVFAIFLGILYKKKLDHTYEKSI